MVPLYFGSKQRRLFGIYEPANAQVGPSRAVLLCHAWGTEYLNSYRAMRFVASQFVAAGIHTMRFDYYGAGDSGGETTDAELPGWRGDIESAAHELQAMSNSRLIVLLGLRLGANLAAEVAPSLRQLVHRVVLWDPIVSGAEYIDGLNDARALLPRLARRQASDSGPAAPVELDGLLVSRAFLSELRAIRSPLRALIVGGESWPPDGSAASPVKERSSEHLAHVPASAPSPWINDPDQAGALPVSTVKQIIEWLH